MKRFLRSLWRPIGRFFRSFRRLRWKLTASYTLVTVATLIVIQLAVLAVGVVAIVELVDRIPSIVVRRLSAELGPQVSPYLAGEAPDLPGIHAWLADARVQEATAVGSDLTPFHLDIIDRDDPRTRLLVLDAAGQLLGDSRQAAPLAEPLPRDDSLTPGIEGTLPDALGGVTQTFELFEFTESGWMTFAVPLRDPDGGVVGALVLSGPLTPAALAVGVSSITVVVVSGVGLVLFTIAAGIIGTFLGSLIARRISRRLDRVAAAAAAWGQGDFSPVIHDRSADEVGELARNLNGMASDLRGLLQARQQLSAAEERNRLARDLHDSVKQQVFATSMNLAAARALWEQDPEAARARLESAAELVRLSQEELTGIIHTLRPAQLESKGLGQALAEHVERVEGQTGMAATFEMRGDAPLPQPVEDALFRVAGEALSNAARHSRASAVRVAVTVSGGAASLLVEDNGRGFDARSRAAGVGLHSMRERVEALGGSLQVRSGSAGTAVLARIPVEG